MLDSFNPGADPCPDTAPLPVIMCGHMLLKRDPNAKPAGA